MHRFLSTFILILLLVACSTNARQANTNVLLVPDLSLPQLEGIAKTGDVFVTAVQQSPGGASLLDDAHFRTSVGGGQVQSGEALFESRLDGGAPVYCTTRKAMHAMLTYNENFSACFRDADQDGSFDHVSLLDFRNKLSFGSGALRHEAEISPVKYRLASATQAPSQRVGLKYLGSGHYLATLHEGRQYKFRWVAEIDGKWKRTSDTFGVTVPEGQTRTMAVFGGVYEIRRAGEENIAFSAIEPIKPAIQQNRTVTIIKARY